MILVNFPTLNNYMNPLQEQLSEDRKAQKPKVNKTFGKILSRSSYLKAQVHVHAFHAIQNNSGSQTILNLRTKHGFAIWPKQK